MVYSKSFMYILRNLIFRKIYDQKGKLKTDYLSKPDSLCRTFRLFGMVCLFGLGPICIFVSVYFLMRHTEEFRSQRSSPLERQFSHY